MECANDEGPRETAPAFEELHNIDMDLTGLCVSVRLDGMEKGIFSMVNIQ